MVIKIKIIKLLFLLILITVKDQMIRLNIRTISSIMIIYRSSHMVKIALFKFICGKENLENVG